MSATIQIKSVSYKHTEEIIPCKRNVRLKKGTQLSLFNEAYTPHVQMGLFYEILTTAIFGGELMDSIKFKDRSYFHSIKPDVLNKKDKMFIESKALKLGQAIYCKEKHGKDIPEEFGQEGIPSWCPLEDEKEINGDILEKTDNETTNVDLTRGKWSLYDKYKEE